MVLLRTLELDVQNVIEVVRACIALHNFLMIKKDRNYAPAGYLDSEDEHGHLVLNLLDCHTNHTVTDNYLQRSKKY